LVVSILYLIIPVYSTLLSEENSENFHQNLNKNVIPYGHASPLDLDIADITFNKSIFIQPLLNSQFKPPQEIKFHIRTHNEGLDFFLNLESSPEKWRKMYQKNNTNTDNSSPTPLYPLTYSFTNSATDTVVNLVIFGHREGDFFGFFTQNGVQFDFGTVSMLAAQQGVYITQDDVCDNEHNSPLMKTQRVGMGNEQNEQNEQNERKNKNSIHNEIKISSTSMSILSKLQDSHKFVKYTVTSPGLDEYLLNQDDKSKKVNIMSVQQNDDDNSQNAARISHENFEIETMYHNREYILSLLSGGYHQENDLDQSDEKKDQNDQKNDKNHHFSPKKHKFITQSIPTTLPSPTYIPSLTPSSTVANRRVYRTSQPITQNASNSQQDSHTNTFTTLQTSTGSSSGTLLPYAVTSTLQSWPACVSSTTPHNFPIHITIHANLASHLKSANIIANNDFNSAWSYISGLVSSYMNLYGPIMQKQANLRVYPLAWSTSLMTQTESSLDVYTGTSRVLSTRPYIIFQVGYSQGFVAHDPNSISLIAYTIDFSRFLRFLPRAMHLAIAYRGGLYPTFSGTNGLNQLTTALSTKYGLHSMIQPLDTSTGVINGNPAHIAGDVGFDFDFYSTQFCAGIVQLINQPNQYITPDVILPYQLPSPTCGNNIVEEGEECDGQDGKCDSNCRYLKGFDCISNTQCCVNGLLQPIQTQCGSSGFCSPSLNGVCYQSSCYTGSGSNLQFYNPFAAQKAAILASFNTYTSASELQRLACNYVCTSLSTNSSGKNVSADIGSKCEYFIPSVYSDENRTTPKPFYGLCQRPLYDQRSPNDVEIDASSDTVLCIGGYDDGLPANNEYDGAQHPSDPTPPVIRYAYIPLSDQYPQCNANMDSVMLWKCVRTDSNRQVDELLCVENGVRKPNVNFTCGLLCGPTGSKIECKDNNNVCVPSSGNNPPTNRCTTATNGDFIYSSPQCFINNLSVSDSRCSAAINKLNSQNCIDVTGCPFVVTYSAQDGGISGIAKSDVNSQICNSLPLCGPNTITLVPKCVIGLDIVDCNDQNILDLHNDGQSIQTDFICSHFNNCQWGLKCPNLDYSATDPSSNALELPVLDCSDPKTQDCSDLGDCLLQTTKKDRIPLCYAQNPNKPPQESYFKYNPAVHGTTTPTDCQNGIAFGYYICPGLDTGCLFEVKCKTTLNSGVIQRCSSLVNYCPVCSAIDVDVGRESDGDDKIVGCFNTNLAIFDPISDQSELKSSKCNGKNVITYVGTDQTEQSEKILTPDDYSELFSYTCKTGPTMPPCEYNLTCLDIRGLTPPADNTIPSGVPYVDCNSLPYNDLVHYYCPEPIDISTLPPGENLMDYCGKVEELDLKCSWTGDGNVFYTRFDQVQEYCKEYQNQFTVHCPSLYIECPCNLVINGLSTKLNSGIDCRLVPKLEGFKMVVPKLVPILTPSTYDYLSTNHDVIYSEQFVTFLWNYQGRDGNNVVFFLHNIETDSILELKNVKTDSILTPSTKIKASKLSSRIYLPGIGLGDGLYRVLFMVDGILQQQGVEMLQSAPKLYSSTTNSTNNGNDTDGNDTTPNTDPSTTFVLSTPVFFLQNRCKDTPCQHKTTCDTTTNTCTIDRCFTLGCRNMNFSDILVTSPSFVANNPPSDTNNEDSSQSSGNSTETPASTSPCTINSISGQLETCNCISPYFGRFCIALGTCQNTKCQNDGYIPFSQGSCNENQACTCRNKWIGDVCETCSLKRVDVDDGGDNRGDSGGDNGGDVGAQAVNRQGKMVVIQNSNRRSITALSYYDETQTCGVNSAPNDECSKCKCQYGWAKPSLADFDASLLPQKSTKNAPKVDITDCSCRQSYGLAVFNTIPTFFTKNMVRREKWLDDVLNTFSTQFENLGQNGGKKQDFLSRISIYDFYTKDQILGARNEFKRAYNYTTIVDGQHVIHDAEFSGLQNGQNNTEINNKKIKNNKNNNTHRSASDSIKISTKLDSLTVTLPSRDFSSSIKRPEWKTNDLSQLYIVISLDYCFPEKAHFKLWEDLSTIFPSPPNIFDGFDPIENAGKSFTQEKNQIVSQDQIGELSNTNNHQVFNTMDLGINTGVFSLAGGLSYVMPLYMPECNLEQIDINMVNEDENDGISDRKDDIGLETLNVAAINGRRDVGLTTTGRYPHQFNVLSNRQHQISPSATTLPSYCTNPQLQSLQSSSGHNSTKIVQDNWLGILHKRVQNEGKRSARNQHKNTTTLTLSPTDDSDIFFKILQNTQSEQINPKFESMVTHGLYPMITTEPSIDDKPKKGVNTPVIVIFSVIFGSLALAILLFVLAKMGHWCKKCSKQCQKRKLNKMVQETQLGEQRVR
jgi:hypothetical protein